MNSSPVTFLYTNSYDTTADLLIIRLGSEKVFRFNFDLWRDYSIHIDTAGFCIESPTGRRVKSADVAKAYWRKPMRKQHMFPEMEVPRTENYLEEELWYAMREMINFFWLEGKLVLVEPFGDLRAGKLVQARIAQRYFKVPSCKFISGSPAYLESKISVVKSLTSIRAQKEAVVYTTRVNENELDPSTPWMIQDLITAEKDITVAFVHDKLFCFELPRDWFAERTVDWREVSLEPASSDWPPHRLPAEMENNVFRYMEDVGLQYGRLDFLYASGDYYFLEVNSNGEWGWLDVDGRHGLLDKIVTEVSPNTPVHALPCTRRIQFT